MPTLEATFVKATTLTLLAVAALLTGCSGDGEPAAPPTQEDALTTVDPGPTTQEPVDDEVTTSAPPDDVSVTTEAGGPPEMPALAQEDSEAGAIAFVEHYLNTFNYSTMTPEAGLLGNLTAEDCETCATFDDIVNEYVSNKEHTAGPILTFDNPTGSFTGDHAVVFVDAVQSIPARLDATGDVVKEEGSPQAFNMSVRLQTSETGWRIHEIQIGSAR